MKKYLFLLLSLITLSCEVEIMDNRRSQFKGELVDENNTNLSGAKVNLGIEIPGFKTSSFQTIAEDITNEQGQFDFLTLQPENKFMYLRISNISEESNFSLELVQITLNNSGPLFDFGEMRIRIPRRFSVNFQNTSGSEEQVFFEYTYITFTPLESVLPGWRTVRGYDMEYEESEEKTLLGTFGENTEKIITLTTLLNTEIKLHYSIGEPLHISDNIQEINFVIDQTINEYVVEY